MLTAQSKCALCAWKNPSVALLPTTGKTWLDGYQFGLIMSSTCLRVFATIAVWTWGRSAKSPKPLKKCLKWLIKSNTIHQAQDPVLFATVKFVLLLALKSLQSCSRKLPKARIKRPQNWLFVRNASCFFSLRSPLASFEAIEQGKWCPWPCAGGAICLPCRCKRHVGSWAAKLELRQPDRTVITTLVGCKADLSQVATRVERAGFEPATFRLQARHSNHRATPRPIDHLVDRVLTVTLASRSYRPVLTKCIYVLASLWGILIQADQPRLLVWLFFKIDLKRPVKVVNTNHDGSVTFYKYNP